MVLGRVFMNTVMIFKVTWKDEFIDQIGNYQRLKKYSAGWRQLIF